MSGSWYETGFDGLDAEQQRLDDQQGPQRLWMPGATSKDVVYADDNPVCIYEHNPKMNGNYRNWMTCIQGVHDEVVCCQKLGPNSRYYCGYLTIVDCSEWKDTRGNIHQYEMRLLQLKLRSLKKFKRKKEDHGAMIGTMWKLRREDDNAPTCGDEWDFVRDIEMDKMFDFVLYRGKNLTDMWTDAEADAEVMKRLQRIFQIKPNEDGKLPRVVPAFNYFEVLKPKTPKEIRLLVGAVQEDDDDKRGRSKSQGGQGAVKEDKVPF